jgi:DUF3102 family protein
MKAGSRRVALLPADLDEGPVFDYEACDPSVAKFLKGQADRIRRYVRTSAIQIGKDLIGAKHYLSHGEFLCWVRREVEIPVRTAQVYMQVAQWASEKSACVACLPPSLLYALSARGTPIEFSKAVLGKIEAGVPVTGLFVREQLVALRKMKRTRNIAASTGMGDERQLVTDDENDDVDCGDEILEAVTIIFRGLEAVDFERVKAILIRDVVLRDPMMNRKIAMAFDTVVASDNSLILSHDDLQPRSERSGRTVLSQRHGSFANAAPLR